MTEYRIMPAVQLVVRKNPLYTLVADKIVWEHIPGIGWITRFLVWMLGVLGAYPVVKGVEPAFVQVNFYTEDLLKYIREAKDGVRWMYGKDVKYLVVGRDIAGRLMDLEDKDLPFGVVSRYRGPIDNSFRVYDLAIVIVPWMDGMVLLPELPNA